MITEFPTLYGESSHGRQKVWTISVTESPEKHGIIQCAHGYFDGKQIESRRVVTEGKNIGKKNATSPLEQAINEAKSLWQKKHDSGYAEARTETSSVAVVPLPMLAHDYNKRGKSIHFPCYVQRKLDGVRCLAIPGRGLFSRNGKQFPHLEHVYADLTIPPNIILDGELYSDELTFNEIVGIVKKETLRPGDDIVMKKIYLYVYDCIILSQPDLTYKNRYDILKDIFTKVYPNIRLLPTSICTSDDDMKRLHGDYVAEGYEGIMLRQINGKYKVGHRSAELQKYKEFFDSEYPITGFKQGDGEEKGCIIWQCKTPAGLEFSVRPRGTRAERIELFAKGTAYIGKLLTVRYQELTTDGIPRFPVGITFRDYE